MALKFALAVFYTLVVVGVLRAVKWSPTGTYMRPVLVIVLGGGWGSGGHVWGL